MKGGERVRICLLRWFIWRMSGIDELQGERRSGTATELTVVAVCSGMVGSFATLYEGKSGKFEKSPEG